MIGNTYKGRVVSVHKRMCSDGVRRTVYGIDGEPKRRGFLCPNTWYFSPAEARAAIDMQDADEDAARRRRAEEAIAEGFWSIKMPGEPTRRLFRVRSPGGSVTECSRWNLADIIDAMFEQHGRCPTQIDAYDLERWGIPIPS